MVGIFNSSVIFLELINLYNEVLFMFVFGKIRVVLLVVVL